MSHTSYCLSRSLSLPHSLHLSVFLCRSLFPPSLSTCGLVQDKVLVAYTVGYPPVTLNETHTSTQPNLFPGSAVQALRLPVRLPSLPTCLSQSSSLSLSVHPVLVNYLIFSTQMIHSSSFAGLSVSHHV